MNLEELQKGHVFLIDKPLDWTSFDVVNKIRIQIKHHFNIKKIKVGHAGTLDPKATGLLVVCTGKATKTISKIQDASKVYTVRVKLGAETLSYDTETEEINPTSIDNIEVPAIKELEGYFSGEFEQYPPIFSAIKKEGKKLYEYARAGEQVEIAPRKIQFYEFKITDIQLPFIAFSVHCSKGTYIRSLANDAGKYLGCGGYLYSLRRETIGNYSVVDANNDILENPDFFN